MMQISNKLSLLVKCNVVGGGADMCDVEGSERNHKGQMGVRGG